MKVKVVFEQALIVSNHGREKSQNKFYPFDRVSFELQEDMVCPFCGRKLNSISHQCCCKDWREHFSRLQEKNGDVDHRSSLNYENVADVVKISNLEVCELSHEEISRLGADFWDDAVKFANNWLGATFLVNSGSYEEGHVRFYCKDCITKVVYLCKIDMVLNLKQIRLEDSGCRRISPNMVDRRRALFPKIFAAFKGWQGFYQALQEA